jgi:putative ABC transport system permease protein
VSPSIPYPILGNPTTWYRIYTAAGLAWDSIKAHRLRSFLTLLGVVIGVASVIIVGAAISGLGVQAQVTTERAFGSESYLVAQIASVGRRSRKEIAVLQRYNKRIRPEDYEYLKASTGDQILYSPYVQSFDDAKRGEITLETAVVLGCAASLPDIRDVALVEGRFFTEQEERNRAFVAVVGDDIKAKLFNDRSPVNGTIRLKGYEFRIVGLQEKLGSSFGRSQDNSIYIPFYTWQKIYPLRGSLSVFGRPRADSGLSLDDGLDVTRAALRTHFKAKPGKPDNFEFLTPDSIRGFIDSILGLISIVVVPVTMISLLVGGIVIMNIMLVSVTERTREIGVRKAIGARQSDIMLQFLTESIITSGAGGLLGLGLGYLVAYLATNFLGATLVVTLPYVLLALFVSGAVGIISGWYPARRAARLDPVVALRAE